MGLELANGHIAANAHCMKDAYNGINDAFGNDLAEARAQDFIYGLPRRKINVLDDIRAINKGSICSQTKEKTLSTSRS